MQYWVHNLDPFAIRFPEEWILPGIRWYGLAYLAGLLGAYCLLQFYHKRAPAYLSKHHTLDIMPWLLFGAIIGGRLGFMLLYDLDGFLGNPLKVIEVWNGGMASHGGALGILIAIHFYAKQYGLSFWLISDLMVTVLPIGIFFGRIANFVNGDLWGKVTEVPWAVIFPQSAPWLPVDLIAARHPSQLYEAALEGIVLFIYMQIRFWVSYKRMRPGQLLGEFMVNYSIVRIIVEFFRQPDASLILGMSRGQSYSLIGLILGIIILIFINKNHRHSAKEA